MIWPRLLVVPASNAAKSLIDNFLRRPAEPCPGSVLYCDVAAGYAAHSGIYVGDGAIVHLHGSGRVELATPNEFMRRLAGWGTAVSIYISCAGTLAVGDKSVAERALAAVGRTHRYHLLHNNCHRFTAACLTGNAHNRVRILAQLKWVASDRLGADTWRIWARSTLAQVTSPAEPEHRLRPRHPRLGFSRAHSG